MTERQAGLYSHHHHKPIFFQVSGHQRQKKPRLRCAPNVPADTHPHACMTVDSTLIIMARENARYSIIP